MELKLVATELDVIVRLEVKKLSFLKFVGASPVLTEKELREGVSKRRIRTSYYKKGKREMSESKLEER